MPAQLAPKGRIWAQAARSALTPHRSPRASFTAAIAALIYLVAPAAANADSFEPNDGLYQAYGPIAAATSYSGDIGTANDDDWFVLYTSGQGVLDVAMTNTPDASGCNATLQLLDTDGTRVGVIRPLPNQTLHVTYTAPGPRRFFVNVGGSCAGDAYQFSVTGPVTTGPAIVAATPTSDVNDSAAQAVGPLSGDTVYGGRIDSQNDEDWFSFYTAGAEPFDLAMIDVPDGSGCHAVMTLRDGDGARLDSARPLTNQIAHIRLTPPRASRYLVQVAGGCAGDIYQFQVGPAAALTFTLPPLTSLDRDGDGINDSVDHCPDIAGVAPDGCPPPSDRDGDGVPDATDRCPDRRGEISNAGCPITVTSSVNLKRRNEGYSGRVTATRPGCQAGRRAVLRRAGAGTRSFRSTTSRADGTFTIRRAHRLRGTVYVVVLARTTGTVICQSARSRALR